MAKLNLEDLHKLRDSKKAEQKNRESEGKDILVTIGMGTCGIAAGARAALDRFESLLDENKLADTVFLRQTGCMGLCHVEPTVEVTVPGMPTVIYGPVDPAAAEKIIRKHIIGRVLLDDIIRDRPAADIV